MISICTAAHECDRHCQWCCGCGQHGFFSRSKPPKSSPGEEPGSIVVDGIPVGTAEDLTKLIVQNAMNDVIPVVESPDQITVGLQNVPGQPNSQRVVATIYMGKPYKTCGQAGFRTAQDCLDGVDLDYDTPPSLVASVNEAINNGKLKERLLYWADHFDADWADDLAPAAGPANNAMTQLNSGLHGKVGSIEKWCGAASRRTNAADAATPHPRCRAGFSSSS